MSSSGLFRFAVDDRADGGKLKPDSKIVQKAGRLFLCLPPWNFSRHQFAQLGSGQPKRMLDQRIRTEALRQAASTTGPFSKPASKNTNFM